MKLQNQQMNNRCFLTMILVSSYYYCDEISQDMQNKNLSSNKKSNEEKKRESKEREEQKSRK